MLVKSLCEAYLRYHPENQYRADFRLSHRDLCTNMCTRNQGNKKEAARHHPITASKYGKYINKGKNYLSIGKLAHVFGPITPSGVSP